jgi:hypothetical protein
LLLETQYFAFLSSETLVGFRRFLEALQQGSRLEVKRQERKMEILR